MAIKQLDLIIHPFYDKNQEGKMDAWKERINAIAKNRGHFLAIRAHRHDLTTTKAREAIATLHKYALEKLGAGRVFFVQDPLDGDKEKRSYADLTRQMAVPGWDPRQIKVNLYGEYAEYCVVSGITGFMPLVVPKPRIRQASRVLLRLTDGHTWGLPSIKKIGHRNYSQARKNIRDAYATTRSRA